LCYIDIVAFRDATSKSIIKWRTGMPAKTLAPRDVRRLHAYASRGRSPLRDRVMILLSFKAGLRACEIAGLDWAMVLAANGLVGHSIMLSGDITKYGRGRGLPLHDELRSALSRLHSAMGKPRSGPVVRSLRGPHMRARSVVNWFREAYAELALDGCSSHSGRRTFITQSARLVAKAGGCLRDVQELAGHRAITTTERYIEGDRDAQRKLVRML
jgi:integrase/recombinase XerC